MLLICITVISLLVPYKFQEILADIYFYLFEFCILMKHSEFSEFFW